VSGRQGRLLAGQAILSALILVVVYVTLLRPEGDGSLTKVETPSGAGQTPSHQRKQANREPANGRRPGNRRTATTAPLLLPGELPSSVPGNQGPTDSQYSDTLTELKARLAGG
jgi:hypothetical protein